MAAPTLRDRCMPCGCSSQKNRSDERLLKAPVLAAAIVDNNKVNASSFPFISREPEPEVPRSATAALLRDLTVPLVALLLGCIAVLPGMPVVLKTLGTFLVYFGTQTCMNLYMKVVLSDAVVKEGTPQLRGFPAAFAVTGIQQITAFLCFLLLMAFSRLTSHPYTPKRLNSRNEMLAICLFSFSFVANIALNNYSLSLMDISLNLVIRSCIPLSTLITQQLVTKVMGDTGKSPRLIEVGLMSLGVACAALAVVAKVAGRGHNSSSGQHVLLGSIICVCSLFSGSLTLVFASMIGTRLNLNPLDTTYYMSLPASIFLLIPVFFMPHTVGWPGLGLVTDWEIVKQVGVLKPALFGFALLSGLFALMYNILQWWIVQKLSATHTAFAGNFNKAATIVIALSFGMERLPSGGFGMMMVAAVVGNIIAFTAFTLVTLKEKDDKDKKAAKDILSDAQEKLEPQTS